MALDFPNAPTNGQSFTAPNGVIWTWDGVKWINGTGVATYAPIASPPFTGDPTAPTPAYGDNDTSVATTAFVQAAVAPMTHNVGRNLLHNSLFNIAQRGAGPWTVSAYTADRWKTGITTDTATFSIVPMADADRAAIGDEAVQSALYCSFTGNAAAGAQTSAMQPIENVRRLAGKTVTVSFWAQGSTVLKLGINIYQYFGTGGSPSSAAYALATGAAVTVSGTWARYSATIAIPSAAGKTLGANGDHQHLAQFFYSSGATGNAIAGNIGVQSGVINLWGVQLEIGSVATPLEQPDPQQDLAKCQRFYQTGHANNYGYSSTSSGYGSYMNFPTTMRAAPTMTLSNTTYINASGAAATGPSARGFQPTVLCTTTGVIGFETDYTASADL